jgi:hypothetical protein
MHARGAVRGRQMRLRLCPRLRRRGDERRGRPLRGMLCLADRPGKADISTLAVAGRFAG